MNIEPATPEDAAEILALQKAAYLSEGELYGDLSIPPLTQTLEELVQSFGRNTILKAVQEGRIVGSVNGRISNGRCLVGRLMVRPDLQGRGLGTLLLAAIEEKFADAVCYQLFTGEKSVANIRLYERLGYRVYERKEVPGSVAVVFMEKKGRAAT
ncbi:acetyltransferase, GNAT family [Citrifermentans bemidjiense Bem]|uniref:Acetyltransferase, GNAT family n=1 Tax=Citrifermentans bemidjiense (strain ATCC BAA-1014 / DSM 16622 / JCM 12645 / Bem) TaxID=404380 RepID=B5EA42_CITBB|nr:GNAT family N-acetyltransferase [Citrifermentans bemidjiense]ACH38748.1 acetyltransferase, GNAT family [Citrifermentans bemidjiense Bem]